MELYWVNRDTPFFVQSVTIACSGRPVIVRTPVANKIGAPMQVAFRMAPKSQINSWGAMTDPFTMFGRTVVWAPGGFPPPQNEVLSEGDTGVSNGADGLDLYKGTMNFIIIG